MKVWLHAIVSVLFCAVSLSGQETCLTMGRIAQVREQIKRDSQLAEDPKLKKELLKLGEELADAITKSHVVDRESQKAKRELAEIGQRAGAKVCSILESTGWPKRSAVGVEGSNAFLYLITRALDMKKQHELYPVIVAAFEKGEVEASLVLASYVDRLRLALGRGQLYGSQVMIKDGFLVMAPIERASEVDNRRAEFKLPPLRSYERQLEMTYRMPLIRGVMEPIQGTIPRRISIADPQEKDAIDLLQGEEPVINLETVFVSIDVSIPDSSDPASTRLEKADFKLYDNGKPVEIETFSKADTPFDIVLLLDLSGSTSDKVGLIKKTTRLFVEMKRPADRVAVVTFNDRQTIVSELEADQAALLERIKKIEGNGASRVWDAVVSGIEMLERKSDKGRRKAIVMMSDGVDNLLGFYPTATTRAGFADLAERIRNSNVSIFPIYLDTERSNARLVYENARKTLNYMADQSGGTVYTAKKLEDLEQIYDRVLKDVGTVYTLGFSPDVETGDRQWRTIRIEVPSRPNLKLRHRPGYFVK